MKVKIDIRTVEISGFASMLQGLRLPFGLEVRSNVNAQYSYVPGVNPYITTNSECSFDVKDLELLKSLIRRGDEHAKVVRAITVFAEIKAPRYIWAELDTYGVGVIPVSSESTMHIECKGMSVEELVEYKDKLQEGHLQRRIRGFSYQTLRRIYKQRRNHRLPHWKVFCEWIESLPLAQELILHNIETTKN